jgi:hypothetical protein
MTDSGSGPTRHTDKAVDEWLDGQRARFLSSPADESLKDWAHHAASLGEREASRLFMTEWASGEPRTGDVLNTPQFHLAQLGCLTEAVEVQREAVGIGDVAGDPQALHRYRALRQDADAEYERETGRPAQRT